MSEKRKVGFNAECAIEDLPKAGKKRAKSVARKLSEGCPSEPLHGELRGLHRATVGSYRVIFEERELGGASVLWVLEVGHRDKVYDESLILKRRRE